jgi:hypothetical protein
LFKIEKMATIAPSSLVRTLCQHRLEPLLAELESAFESELGARSAAADQRARSELSETLNQYARRLRQARGFGEISAILVDLAGRFCRGLAVFRIRDNMVQGERVRAPLNPPAALAIPKFQRTRRLMPPPKSEKRSAQLWYAWLRSFARTASVLMEANGVAPQPRRRFAQRLQL